MNSLFRAFLWIILIVETPVQAYLAFDWITRLGLLGAIIKWFASARLDTIYATAVIDFTVVIFVLMFWFAQKLAPLRKERPLVFGGWMVLLVLFPSLALVVYFLFLEKNRLVTTGA